MNKQYLPILRAKEGELVALSNLSAKAKDSLTPLLDISLPDEDAEGLTISMHLAKVASKIGKVWSEKTIYLDMFNWLPNSISENGQHVLLEAWKELEGHKVITNVVLGLDRWDDLSYKIAIKNILSHTPRKVCLRLDLDAINDMRTPEFFDEIIESIFDYLGLNSSSVSVLLDAEDITQVAMEDILDNIFYAIEYLELKNFKEVIVAGSSIPAFVTEAVKNENSSALIIRKEMILWKTLVADGKQKIIFGDYGVRNPKSSGKGYGNTNGKIRYTVENQYFIVRGHNLQKPPKGKQHYSLAKKVVNSSFYAGAEFSWGDKKILDCSNQLCIGNSTNWISIDTNHHIEYVLNEIKQFHSDQLSVDQPELI